MKNNKYIKLFTASLIAATPILWSSCTDEWNEHFGISSEMANAPSLYTSIQSDKDLAPFLRVLQATGYDKVLSSPNMLTVFAPKMTDEQANSIIETYNEEKARTSKDDDNKAIKQFIQNHIAMYARNVVAGQTDTVSMLNKKYMILKGASETTGTLETLAKQGQEFTNKIIGNNGFMYKTNGIVDFYPNIREYMDNTSGFDSINNVFKTHDYYYLNESASVPGGVVDGKTVYLDSVTYIINPIEKNFDGYLNAEDSSYVFIAPTNDVYNSLYAQYSKYFVYIKDQVESNYADSLTKTAILSGRFFNSNSGYSLAPQDSLCNTEYSMYQSKWKTQDDRKNVWYGAYNPSSKYYFGKAPNNCSNGIVIMDDELRTGETPNSGLIAKEKTFFRPEYFEAEHSFYYTVEQDATTGRPLYNTITRQAYDEIESHFKDPNTGLVDTVLHHFKVSNDAYVEVTRADGSTTSGVTIKYRAGQNMGQTVANVPYNIYLVTAPSLCNTETPSDTLANRISITMKVYNPDGTTSYFDGQTMQDSKKAVNLKNPEGFYERTSKGEFSWCDPWTKEYFVNKTNVVDTIQIARAVVFPTAGLRAPEGDGFELTLSSYITTSYKKYYSPTLRLDQFIIIPFDTKEEAENYDIKAANRKE